MKRTQKTTWADIFAQWHGWAISPCQGLRDHLEYVLSAWDGLDKPILKVAGSIITDLESWLHHPRRLSELGEVCQALTEFGHWVGPGEAFEVQPTGRGLIYPDDGGNGWHLVLKQ